MNFLWVTYICSISLGFSCCSPDDAYDGFNEKHHTDQLSISSKEHPEDNHHCQCKKCEIPDTKDNVLLSTYTKKLEGKKIFGFIDNTSETRIILIKDIVTYTNNKYPPTFHPIFLLKSSFLL